LIQIVFFVQQIHLKKIMAKTTRLAKTFFRLFLPVGTLILVAFVASSIWLIYEVSRPFKSQYMVTPAKYGQLSARGARITEETWNNQDGTSARGWLLRGAEGLPAVVLFHRFGADRSQVLDLGVKINESTNFTILMPDLRGHGMDPLVPNSSFGGCEARDAASAVQFLKDLKTEKQTVLVGENIGFYGVELGALIALNAASEANNVKALVLDSVPTSSDQVLSSSIEKRFPFASIFTSTIATYGTRLYYYNNCYDHEGACSLAKAMQGKQVLLLAGSDVPELQATTEKVLKCMSDGTSLESKLDFNPSGYSLSNATVEQLNIYDQKVIDFFAKALR
jgi:pimeloyl-ACP methyl ester carboxylesterase